MVCRPRRGTLQALEEARRRVQTSSTFVEGKASGRGGKALGAFLLTGYGLYGSVFKDKGFSRGLLENALLPVGTTRLVTYTVGKLVEDCLDVKWLIGRRDSASGVSKGFFLIHQMYSRSSSVFV